MALGPVALTTAAQQRAEEEKDRSWLHHPQSSSRAGFPFFPSFLSFPLPGSRCRWPGLSPSGRRLQPQPFLSPVGTAPISIGPRSSTTSSPRGISRGRFLIFFQVRLLHNTQPAAKATAPSNPGMPLTQRGPVSPHWGALPRYLHPGMWLRSSSVPVFCRLHHSPRAPGKPAFP